MQNGILHCRPSIAPTRDLLIVVRQSTTVKCVDSHHHEVVILIDSAITIRVRMVLHGTVEYTGSLFSVGGVSWGRVRDVAVRPPPPRKR